MDPDFTLNSTLETADDNSELFEPRRSSTSSGSGSSGSCLTKIPVFASNCISPDEKPGVMGDGTLWTIGV